MQVQIRAQAIHIKDEKRAVMEDSLVEAVSKYFPRAVDGEISFSKEGSRALKVVIRVRSGRGIIATSNAVDSDAMAAFEVALAKVSKQLRRYKRKLIDHHEKETEAFDDMVAKTANYYLYDTDEEQHIEDEHGASLVIAENSHQILEMTVSDAIMKIDTEGLAVLLFVNKGNDSLNVVYRREDGNIGWIEPH